MTTDTRSTPSPLPLTRAQIQAIARQEGADTETIREAVRRMGESPRLHHGEVHSPGAFFRGIVRGVIADRNAAYDTRRALRPTPSADPPEAPVGPDRIAGRMALRAQRLFAAGAEQTAVCAQLQTEFPHASSDLVAWAVTNGLALYHALARRSSGPAMQRGGPSAASLHLPFGRTYRGRRRLK